MAMWGFEPRTSNSEVSVQESLVSDLSNAFSRCSYDIYASSAPTHSRDCLTIPSEPFVWCSVRFLILGSWKSTSLSSQFFLKPFPTLPLPSCPVKLQPLDRCEKSASGISKTSQRLNGQSLRGRLESLESHSHSVLQGMS